MLEEQILFCINSLHLIQENTNEFKRCFMYLPGPFEGLQSAQQFGHV